MGFLLPPPHPLRRLLAVLTGVGDPSPLGAPIADHRASLPPLVSADRPRESDRPSGERQADDPVVAGSLDLLARLLGVVDPDERDDPELERLLAPDVSLWSPHLLVHSRAQLVDALRDTDDSLEQTRLTVDMLDAVPPRVYAQWHLTGIFTNPCFLGDDVLIEPNGRPVCVAGMTVTRIVDGQIHDVHCYFDDLALLEQLTADRRSP